MAKIIVDWKTLFDFVEDAFVGVGVPREDAKICADVLLESDKRGIESHGVNRFKPIYIDRINIGIQNPVTEYEIIRETATTAVVDGHDGSADQGVVGGGVFLPEGGTLRHQFFKQIIPRRKESPPQISFLGKHALNY